MLVWGCDRSMCEEGGTRNFGLLHSGTHSQMLCAPGLSARISFCAMEWQVPFSILPLHFAFTYFTPPETFLPNSTSLSFL